MTSLNGTANYPLEYLFRPKAPITWVFVPGYTGEPRVVAMLQRTYSVMEPSSMLSSLTRDVRATVGHPRPGREDEYCDLLLQELSDQTADPEKLKISGNIVLVGLSVGGQVVNRVFRHYEARHLENRPLPYSGIANLGLVLMSTPGTVDDLRAPFRQIVKAVQTLRVPYFFGFAIKVFAPWFTPGKVKRQLRKDGRKWVVKLRRRSNARSTWFVAALRSLATSRGLGSVLFCDGRVVTLNMVGDPVVDPDRARAAADAAYVECPHFEYEGIDHGTPEADGPQIAAVLADEIRPHFMALWGLQD